MQASSGIVAPNGLAYYRLDGAGSVQMRGETKGKYTMNIKDFGDNKKAIEIYEITQNTITGNSDSKKDTLKDYYKWECIGYLSPDREKLFVETIAYMSIAEKINGVCIRGTGEFMPVEIVQMPITHKYDYHYYLETQLFGKWGGTYTDKPRGYKGCKRSLAGYTPPQTLDAGKKDKGCIIS
ncbi:hypothetical protein [Candidatus Protochlamydia phocaeensis]|uniref:hypothetical protein n=1 Tax=Candidatus Protochlamydia phocaeensis TaxID=1414722 RepID=UPI0008393548|nr:hypothetical protein [Candidatus Protochlamydia phocaeensis]